MKNIRVQRRVKELFLDGLFVVLLLHFFATGSVVPQAVIDVFRDRPAVVVVSEPVHTPADSGAPIGDGLGEPGPGT